MKIPNQEFKAAWVAALRSGKYKQGFKLLRSASDEFCCIGVAEDIAGACWRESGHGDYYFTAEACSHEVPDTRDLSTLAAGVCLDTCRVLIEGNCATLYSHNDAGKTFAQIADAIEEQL